MKPAADVLTDALMELGYESSEISMELSLAELDVNSIDIVELMEIVREEFDVKLQGQDVMACATLGDVADLIDRGAKAQ
jgi:acyl carrier protein